MTGTDSNNFTRFTIAVFSILASASIVVMYSINYYTQDRIADNKLQAMRKIFNDIIPYQYNNDIFNDHIEVTDPAYLGTNQAVFVYRIRNDETPLGVIIHPIKTIGYESEIQLGIGISKQGIITGVRVTSEDETEGAGDQIHQEKSDWLSIFVGKSHANLPPEQWRVKSENGYFDQISGATITSRSVINAVNNTLSFYNREQDSLYKQ